MQRLDGGLFTLQQLSAIIIFTCLYDKDHNSIIKSQIKLKDEDLCLEDLVNVLREAAVHLHEVKKKLDSDSNGNENNENGSKNGENGIKVVEINSENGIDEDREKQRKLFVSWTTAIASQVEEKEVEEEEDEDDAEEEN